MESALARIRAEVTYHRPDCSWIDAARGGCVVGGPERYTADDLEPPRVLRARVAIALRAALRADEDARCEEAMRRVGGYADGAEAALEAFCEWVSMSPLRRPWERVPLALWERT
jgi:hypothetical protein